MDYSLKTIASADQFAEGYEEYVKAREWTGPDILYNQMKDYIRSGQRLLDVGIGTGLSAWSFHKAGMIVTGIDGSEKMLQECALKGFAEELIQWDIAKGLPSLKECFDHVICFAVLHMIGDLFPFFEGCKNILDKDGYLGFSVIEYKPQRDTSFNKSKIPGVFEELNPESEIYNFRHTDKYIQQKTSEVDFTIVNKNTFLGFRDAEEQREVHFTIYIMKHSGVESG